MPITPQPDTARRLYRAPQRFPDHDDGSRSDTIAIIMRTRDRPILLRRALASVLGQDFQRWHLHIVNDGGDPGSVDHIVAEHRTRLGARVTVQHNARSAGMEAASNQALATATADCFVVHDDDDTWEPGFLSATMAFLAAPDHAGLIGVVTGCANVTERIEGERIVIEHREANGHIERFPDIAQLLVLNRALPICLVYRMSLIAELGGFNPDLPVIGDWDFNIRALLSGDVGVIPAQLASYHTRRAPQSPAYANSMTAGRDRHAWFDRQLRNSILRQGVTHQPDLLGVLLPLLHAVDTAREQTRLHVNQVANAIVAQQRDAFAKMQSDMLAMQVQQEEAIVARILAALQINLHPAHKGLDQDCF